MHYELCIDIASCTTSVYVNLSKNSLMPFGLDFLHDSEIQMNLSFSRCSGSSFFAPDPAFWAKAGAKVLLFSEPPKLFGKNFQFSGKKVARLDKHQGRIPHIHYYNNARERKIHIPDIISLGLVLS